MTLQRKDIFGLILFGLIGLSVVSGGLYWGYSTFEKVKAVASWPTVPGYVTESAIRWNTQSSSSGTRKSYSYFYTLEVRTDYRIDGQYFSNATPGIKEIRDTKYAENDPWKSPPDEEMVRLFKAVPQGTMIPVHFNPENKSESYIFSKLSLWNLYSAPFFLILFGMIFLLLPLGILMFKWFSGN